MVSDLRFIDILPFKQEYQFVEGEGSCSGSSVSLEELIARQRENLSRTFALEREPRSTTPRRSVWRDMRASCTTPRPSLPRGLPPIAGPVPALEEAVKAMQSATDGARGQRRRWSAAARGGCLEGVDHGAAEPAQDSQAELFEPVECLPEIRPPAVAETPPAAGEENKQQLAALEKDLRELARREQKFSEEIEPKGSGGPQLDPPAQAEESVQECAEASHKSRRRGHRAEHRPGRPQGQKSEPEPSLAEQQKQAAQEAERLDKLAQEDEALPERCASRLSQAAGAVSDSSRAMEAGRKAEAAGKAREAARRLGSLARQVGALKAGELSERLARARDFAQEIARAERELGQALDQQAGAGQSSGEKAQGLAARQRELAEDTAALAEVLEQIKAAARLDEPRARRRRSRRPRRAARPGKWSKRCARTPSAIGSGKNEDAARDAAATAEKLEALAQDLENARRAAAGPELERLLAAEKEAAALQERLRTVRAVVATGPGRPCIRGIRRPARSARPARRGLETGGRKHGRSDACRPWRLERCRENPGRRGDILRPADGLYRDAGRGDYGASGEESRRWCWKTPWSSATDRCHRSTRTSSRITTACFPRT